MAESSGNLPPLGVGFDDVIIQPGDSDVRASEAKVSSHLTKRLQLRIPIISAGMLDVTGVEMAAAMASAGGIGTLSRFQPIEDQVKQVETVKNKMSGVIRPPVTLPPGAKLNEAKALMEEHEIPVIPVADARTGKVMGIINNAVLGNNHDHEQMVVDVMANASSVKSQGNMSEQHYREVFSQYNSAFLVIVDNSDRCTGIIVAKDLEGKEDRSGATRDAQGRLRVAAAVGIGDEEVTRAERLLQAGADILILDLLNAHTKTAAKQLTRLRRLPAGHSYQVIAGNVASRAGARMLIDAGSDAIKVGIGSGSISQTKSHSGVAVPQITALQEVYEACSIQGIPVICDGGIRNPSDIAKAFTAGASSVMIGGLLAGATEAPGELIERDGRQYKVYQGNYRKSDDPALTDFGLKKYAPVSGNAIDVLTYLINGLKVAMQYTGAQTVEELQTQAQLMRIR